tara:strand:+ start:976 stop:1497 length:522 start_codon:yes stop_codon:yes gene_type:complete
MADNANAEGDEEIEVGKGGGRMATVLLAVVPAILASVITAYGVNYFMNKPDPAASDPAAQVGEGSSSDEAIELDTTLVPLGPFTVNLRDSSGRVLSMKIQLVINKNEEDEETATKKISEVRDSVLLLASDYSYTELEGIDGKIRLKDDIHARVNSILEPIPVRKVFFTEFVIQ